MDKKLMQIVERYNDHVQIDNAEDGEITIKDLTAVVMAYVTDIPYLLQLVDKLASVEKAPLEESERYPGTKIDPSINELWEKRRK